MTIDSQQFLNCILCGLFPSLAIDQVCFLVFCAVVLVLKLKLVIKTGNGLDVKKRDGKRIRSNLEEK